ncbi:TonB-linked outer membrane protein, SusC/RagA family [bacterium A37T11]|nr:TonB-linked outer membrane protein, SusC/RagA family [bacterium A37T11]
MRIFVFIMTVCCIQVAAKGYAQLVTLHELNQPLTNIFSSVKDQTGFVFIWDEESLGQINTTLNVNQVSLEETLNTLFKNLPFSYRIINKSIIVKRKDEALLKNAKNYPIQQMVVQGKLTDTLGNPLKGALISIKEYNIKTTTDINGAFSILIPRKGVTLIFKFLGMEVKEVVVTDPSQVLDVELKTIKVELESVVVTGLYSRPTENFTGVATTINGDQLRNVNSINVFEALKVFDPAIRIPDNLEFGSDPNKLPQISLRGTNNFPVQQGETAVIPSSGADFMASYSTNPSMPLFILDGFEVSLQKIYDLDINRIDKITVLKDAVATSAYGSRAANGVIVVETKRPLPGKLTLTYTGNIQYTGPDLNSYHLLNASEKLKVEKLGGLYDGRTTNPKYQLYYDKLYAKRLGDIQRGVDTYWLSQPLQSGWGNKQSLFVEGGDNYLRYSTSFAYTNNRGVMKGSSRDNYEGSMMISYRKKQLLVSNQFTISSNRSDNSPYGNFSEYAKLNPYWSPYDEYGRITKVLDYFSIPGYSGETIITNPMYNATIGTTDYSKYIGFNNNTFIEYRPNNSFRLTGKLGLTSQQNESHQYLPADHTSFIGIDDYESEDYYTRGSYTKGNGSFNSYDISLTADYNRNFGKSLIYVTIGTAVAQQKSDAGSFIVRGFPNQLLDQFFLGKEYLRDSRPTGYNNITRRTSAFTSVNYTYDKRYLFDFSWNVDGSSQFGANNRLAPFWAAGIGWNLHEESFMKSLRENFLSKFKIRAGIGTTGSQQFPPYMAVSTYQYQSNQDYIGMFGANILSYGNASLKWQQTLKQNIGSDISFWNDRVTIRLDGYREITNDLLLDINTPPSLGVSSYKQNVGKLENIGVEANISAFLIRDERQSIYLNVFANGIHNQNRIKEISNSLQKMNEANDAIDLQNRPQLRFVEGQSVNAIWAVRSMGIDPSNGSEVFLTKNGDYTYTWSASDKVIVGDAIPDLRGNLGTTFSYKGWQISAYASYQLGGTVYNQTLVDRVENADLRFNVDDRVLYDRWKQPGDETFFKGLITSNNQIVTTATNSTSRFMQRDNFLDLESISLAYIIPETKTSRLKLKNTRINFMVNNLARISTVEIERGLSYPFARNYTVNISTSF